MGFFFCLMLWGMEPLLNPTTGGYTGQRAKSLENAVYLRLMTPLGSYWANPLLGSRLHELAREKDVARVGLLAKQYAEQALATLMPTEAQSIEVTAQQPHNGWLLLEIKVVAVDGQEHVYQHPVAVRG